MSSAEHGVVLFSWGYTGFRPEEIPATVITEIMEAFSQLKQKVIMKFDKEMLPVKASANVLVTEWVPQQDILGQ